MQQCCASQTHQIINSLTSFPFHIFCFFQTGEEKTLAIARNLSRRLRNLTINLSTSIRVLPQNLRQSVEDARSTAEVLFTTFEEAS